MLLLDLIFRSDYIPKHDFLHGRIVGQIPSDDRRIERRRGNRNHVDIKPKSKCGKGPSLPLPHLLICS